MTKINRTMENALRRAVNEIMKDTYVELYASDLFTENNVVEWKINWKAIGSVDPESARKMAKDLNKAAKLADLLNEANYVFTLEKDERIEELLKKGNKEEAKRIVRNMTEAYKAALKIALAFA